ncbi:hypothetical protein AA0114_g4491 [Alternaria tenuissima]|uniref:Zn(2)-C6 fungal-type domain-containing protein n=1 Tax=Alternaria tenuissima TaxID=119927 RepID=A0A4Q4MLF9_9PLEO|nr:hypothetical protein AA0114_g4491 [Alternaria tenuissima]
MQRPPCQSVPSHSDLEIYIRLTIFKCDEQKPNCANCVKQGTVCEYRPSTGQESREASNVSPLPIGTPAFTPSSTDGTSGFLDQQPLPDFGSITINGASSQPDLALNIPQLRLLHHYTTVTAKSLAAHTDAEDVFTTTLVQIAFDHPYLLQAALALSALHLSRTAGPEEAQQYSYQAEKYHEASLLNFQTMVRDIDPSNFKAVLLFAGTLFPHACVASLAIHNDLDHVFDSVLSNLVLTRRIRPMVTGVYEQMKESELGRVIPDDVKNINWQTEEQPPNTELVQLRKFSEVVHHVYPPDIVDAYGYACHILELVFQVAEKSTKPPSDALLKIWIHLVSDRYIELLSERQPGSLIIFAHFAVIMHRAAENYWYLEGVAEQILLIADHMVPSEWKSWLQWPKEQIRGASVPPTPYSGHTT